MSLLWTWDIWVVIAILTIYLIWHAILLFRHVRADYSVKKLLKYNKENNWIQYIKQDAKKDGWIFISVIAAFMLFVMVQTPYIKDVVYQKTQTKQGIVMEADTGHFLFSSGPVFQYKVQFDDHEIREIRVSEEYRKKYSLQVGGIYKITYFENSGAIGNATRVHS